MGTTQFDSLGQALLYYRRKAGLTIRQLAIISGLTPATLSRLEMGRIAKPRPAYLQQLARAFEIDVETLYALAGYLMPEGMPELQPYLRTKYGVSGKEAEQLDEIFQAMRAKWDA